MGEFGPSGIHRKQPIRDPAPGLTELHDMSAHVWHMPVWALLDSVQGALYCFSLYLKLIYFLSTFFITPNNFGVPGITSPTLPEDDHEAE